jgi:hypothetical protein
MLLAGLDPLCRHRPHRGFSINSDPLIPRTSPERAAVRIAKASALAAVPARFRNSAIKAGATRRSRAA